MSLETGKTPPTNMVITTMATSDSEERTLQHALHMEGLRRGFYVSVVALVLAMVLALSGSELSGMFIGTGGVVGLAGTFVYGAQGRRVAELETDYKSRSKS